VWIEGIQHPCPARAGTLQQSAGLVKRNALYLGVMNMSKADVKTTSYRLTPEARRLLAALAERKGVNKTAVLEILIRKEAKEEGIT
jgi:hypothetical protein